MTDEEERTTEFVIEKLGDLVLVLLGEHIPIDENTEEVRWSSRKIFMDLGTWAAKHGRADLMPLLHKQATRIETKWPRPQKLD
ncbi:hypothetical protein GRI89_12585 [Altererythrobacter salegens]|uniref:Uncharacterized protein n=1 Tax=Croceibacterium salegens TaxID=1737568 RepID=A0A6I4SZS6_9SPHN|nr:hypothetical protein [Croceibacterium salegens]MXO60376.1 hypothetical protein [Croceibacterium salegens]